MTTREEALKLVNGLIEKNVDAFKGFKQAAENTTNLPLKSYLNAQASQREQFANNLAAEFRSEDPSADVKDGGSLTGDIHRGWMDVKAAFTSNTDEAILEECLRGDKASVEEYHDVLQAQNEIPASITKLIQTQHDEVHTTMSRVSRLEDLADWAN